MMYYLAIVREIEKDNSIKFDISGLDNFSEKPIALPAENVTKRPEKGDIVLLQQHGDLHTFTYSTLGNKFIGIKNDSALIEITDKDKCIISFPSYSVTAEKTGVTVKLGNVEIKANQGGVTIGGQGTLKVNGLPGAPKGVGPFVGAGAVTPTPGTPLLPITTDEIILF